MRLLGATRPPLSWSSKLRVRGGGVAGAWLGFAAAKVAGVGGVLRSSNHCNATGHFRLPCIVRQCLTLESKTSGSTKVPGGEGAGGAYFDGECSYCHKWGHKRIDCRKRLYDEKQKSSAGARAVSDGAGSTASGAVAAVANYHDETYEDVESWVFAVTADVGGGTVAKVGGSVLIDSGSDDHLCRPRFVPDAPVADSPTAPKLYDVQRNPLPTAGRRGVEMTMAEGVKATADFLVAGVGDDLLSMGS